LDPALEHVDHLERDVVVVELGDLLRLAWGHEADHVRLHHAARGLGHAEVAILGVTTQTQREIPLAEMAHRERLLGAPWRHRSGRPRLDACTLARGGARPCACLLWSHRFPPPMGRGAPHPAVRYPGSPSRGIGWGKSPGVTRGWEDNATRNGATTEIGRSRKRERPQEHV